MNHLEIATYSTMFRRGLLQGSDSDRMCAALAGPLCAALLVLGEKARCMESVLVGDSHVSNHVFIELEDGLVLDPTADQFNGELAGAAFDEIYLGRPAVIHLGASPTPWEDAWMEYASHLRRLIPDYDPFKVGKGFRAAIEALPPEVITFSQGCS